jgi:protein tyrosine phosphatase (PTP) superfamily phosphohydrolase (DUF442 family)
MRWTLLPLALATACSAFHHAPHEHTEDTRHSCNKSCLQAPKKIEASLPVALDIKNFRILRQNIAGGGQPNLAHFSSLKEKGYTQIINLRMPSEPGHKGEAEAAQNAGLRYASIPMGKAVRIADANRLRHLLSKSTRGLTLIHCASGNRVGALFGLARALEEGLSKTDALRAAKEAGMKSELLAQSLVQELQ